LPVSENQDEDQANALANNPRFTAKKIAETSLNNFEFDELKAEYLKRLINLLKTHKARSIILVQPPVRQEFMDIIYMNPKMLMVYKKTISFIHGLEDENVRSLIWETTKNCGLDDSVFLDYGHFNKNGADIFTQKLFNTIKGWGVIMTSGIDKMARSYSQIVRETYYKDATLP